MLAARSTRPFSALATIRIATFTMLVLLAVVIRPNPVASQSGSSARGLLNLLFCFIKHFGNSKSFNPGSPDDRSCVR